MTSRAEDYRARAVACETRAAAADNDLTRRELLGRASAWRQLAQDAESLERITADRAAQAGGAEGRARG
ncbi:MAG: hypothetical protein P4M07_20110 [Xanthobacteraceae bacterium]|nr:hypothetical protein [Xanthobacteraceae bacterium]